MLNSGFRGKRATDGTGAISVQNQSVQATFPIPRITGYAVTDGNFVALDDTVAISGSTIVVYGNNFVTGMTVYINNNEVATTYLDPTRIGFTAPTLSNGTYVIYIITPQGAAAILAPGIVYSGFPTWSTTVYNAIGSTTINIQLLATGDDPLTYSLQSGSSLPTGITLTSTGLLTGTASSVTTDSVFYFTVIVDDAQLQSTQQSITLTFQFGDPYFKYTTLLLNGETSVTPFISDASTNSLPLVIQGDTKPNTFTPYSNGYYSIISTTNNDFLSYSDTTTGNFGTSDFTVEGFFYLSATAHNLIMNSVGTSSWGFLTFGDQLYWQENGGNYGGVGYGTVPKNQWVHLASSRTGGFLNLYINGTRVLNSANTFNYSGTPTRYIGPAAGGASSLLFLSNIRFIKGTGIYSGAAITVPTSPLTAITNTSLLVAQSNRFIDTSPNAITLSISVTPQISSFIPFATPTTATYNTLYSTNFLASGYLTTPGSTALTFSTGDFTIELWVYPTVNARQDWVDFDNNSNVRLLIYYDGTNIVYYSTASPGGSKITGSAMVLYTWQHLALVRISGSSKLYINGVQSGSTYADTINYPSQLLTIGKDNAGSTYVTGYISNLRIVKGLGVYTGAFTTPTSPLASTQSSGTNIVAITGTSTSLLTCAAATFIDNSSYTSTITVVGGVQPIAVSPFNITPTATNTLTTLGSAYFDGTGDYLTTADNAVLEFGSSNFTIECWIFPTSSAAQQIIINKVATGSVVGSYDLRLNTNGTLQYFVSAAAGGVWSPGFNSATTGTVTFNAWNHIAYVRNTSGVFTVYINGLSAGTSTSAITLVNEATTTNIGANGNGTSPFFGYISNVRIVNGTALYTSNFLIPQIPPTAVTNTQLLTLQYKGGANSIGIIDNSPFNTALTKTGNTKQGSFSPYSVTGWSNYFDGTGDYFTLPSNQIQFTMGTGDFTFECWVYIISLASTRTLYDTCNNSDATGTGRFSIQVTTGGVVQVFTTNGSIFTSGGTLVIGTWYHIAYSRASASGKLYVNGVQVNTTYSDTNNYVVGTTSRPVIGINGYDNSSNPMLGYISNLRLVKGTAVYTAAFTPPTTPLTAITNTSLLTCQSNRLIDNSPNNFAITKAGDVSVQALSPFGSIPEAIPLTYSNYFDGTGDYLSTPDNTAFSMGSSDFTFECWVYPTTITAGNNNLLVQWGNGNAWIFKYIAAGRLRFEGAATGVSGTTTAVVANQWNHVAITRSSSIVRLFVNGVADATTATIGALTEGSSQVTIGAYSDGTVEYVTGYISNLRLVVGSCLYTSTFTPSTTPLTAIANTVLLTCQSTTMIDNSTNAFTLTANGNVKPIQFNPFGYTTQVATVYSPSLHGGSAFFDGTTDYLTTPASATYLMTGQDFTVECWAYPTSIPAQAGLVGINNTASSGNANFGIYLETNRNITFWVAGNTTTYSSSNTPITISAWNHIAFVRSGSTNNVYVNGISVLSNAVTPTWSGTPVITVGRLFGDNVGVTFYGYMSDVRVTKRAVYTTPFLPPTQTLGNYSATYPSNLLLNFNTSGIIDAHGTHVLETLGNAQLSTAVKKYGSASMYFDGTGDYLTIPTNPGFVFGTGDFTIEAWFYIVSGSVGAIFDTRSGASGITPLLYFSSSTLRYYMNGSDRITSGTTLSADTWYHVALVRSSGSSKMYLNGAQTGSTYVDTNDFILTNTINIGRGNDNANVLNGYIDDLRITKGFARYTANFSVPTMLVAL